MNFKMYSEDIHILNFKQKLFSKGVLTDSCWNELAKSITFKSLSKTRYFSKAGQHNQEFSYIISGISRIYFLTSKGEEFTKHFIRKGDFLMATIQPDAPSEVTIQALTDVHYLSIPFLKFDELLSKYPELMKTFNRLIFEYFGNKQQREINLLSNSAKQNYLKFTADFPDLEKKVAHYHIASYLGITPTQLSRVRKNLSHQHL